MKRILSIMIAALVLLSSCNKDFLVEDARDAIYADNLYKDKAGFESSLNAVYSDMRLMNTRADSKMTRAQLWQQNSDVVSTRTANINNFVAIGPGFEDGQEAYNWLYQIINTTNLIIDRAEGDVDWQGRDDVDNLANKNGIISQARVARSWAYRFLVYAFGPVPLSVNEVNGSNYTNGWSRNSIEEIKAQMTADLEFAAENLPLKGDDMTRINGAVARHFLGELYLSLGEFQNAIDALKPLCESGPYSLVMSRFGAGAADPDGNHFMDIIRNPYASSGNTETFFVLANGIESGVVLPGAEEINMLESWVGEYEDFNKMKNYRSDFGADNLFSTFGGYGKGRYLMTPYGVSNEKTYKLYHDNQNSANNIDNWIWENTDGRDNFLYEMDDVRGHNESIRRYFVKDWNGNGTLTDPSTMYPPENGDQATTTKRALEKTIIEYDPNYNDRNNQGDTLHTHFQYGKNSLGFPSTSWKFGYPYTRKWEIRPSETDNIGDFHSFHDVGYLRLADSYLLYAEAFMMLGNKTEAAVWINKVRERANASLIDPSQVTLDFLLDERARELIAEEERRITLLRTGKLVERTRKYNPLTKYAIENYHQLYPFPASAIDANKDKVLEQNEGYGGSVTVDFSPPGYPDEIK